MWQPHHKQEGRNRHPSRAIMSKMRRTDRHLWPPTIAASRMGKVAWPAKAAFPLYSPTFLEKCDSPPKVDSEEVNGSDKHPSKSKDPEQPKDPSKSPESSESSSSTTTTSCSAGITTATDCSVACSAFQSTVGSDVVSKTACYTTKCEQTIGCSIEATTTTSITTSEAEACPWPPQTP
jgi:hypothetical protein